MMRRFGCDVTEDAFEGGHHEASLEPILINFPFLWVVVSQAVTQLRFSPHLLAKFEDVVPHQGDLILAWRISCSVTGRFISEAPPHACSRYHREIWAKEAPQ